MNWSYSAVTMYENCPRKYWAVKVGKKCTGITFANATGINEHKEVEAYIKKGRPLPVQLVHMRPVIDKLISQPGKVHVEQEIALDKNFQVVPYRDWANGWVRGKNDLVIKQPTRAVYVDWKTGKFRPSDDQIELASLLLFRKYPEIERVDAMLLFMYHDKTYRLSVFREQATKLWPRFLETVQKIDEAIETDAWPVTPNPLCGYCPYKACPHNRNPKL